MVDFLLILKVFNIGLWKVGGEDDFYYLVFVHEGHFLLQGLDLREVVDFEVGSEAFEGILNVGIPLWVDEVIGDSFTIGKAHFGNVL